MSQRRSKGRRARRSSWFTWRAALAWLVLGLLLGGVLSIGGLWWWGRQVHGAGGGRVNLEVSPDLGRAELAKELERAGLIDDAQVFRLYRRLVWPRATLEPGPHLLKQGSSPATLMACLTRSPRPRAKLTLPEGYNQFQAARRLEENGICAAQVFLEACQSASILSKLGVPAASAEGYLFPATYDLYIDSHAETLLKTFVQESARRYQLLADRHAASVERLRQAFGWGRHEVITLASIVEKESSLDSERGLIAGVFYNRLQDPTFRPARMLQSDPTAGYGCLIASALAPSCQSFKGSITPELLRDPQNPYNTYKHTGLPPGPIANPGESAIEAVLAPVATPYLFFVVAKGGQRHVFSRTWAEHQAAIDELAASGAVAPAPRNPTP